MGALFQADASAAVGRSRVRRRQLFRRLLRRRAAGELKQYGLRALLVNRHLGAAFSPRRHLHARSAELLHQYPPLIEASDRTKPTATTTPDTTQTPTAPPVCSPAFSVRRRGESRGRRWDWTSSARSPRGEIAESMWPAPGSLVTGPNKLSPLPALRRAAHLSLARIMHARPNQPLSPLEIASQ